MSEVIYIVVSMSVETWKRFVKWSEDNSHFSSVEVCSSLFFWEFADNEFYYDKRKAKAKAKDFREVQKRLCKEYPFYKGERIYKVFSLKRNVVDTFKN